MPSQHNHKTLLIFDLDGTIVNTIKDLTVSANYAMELQNFPPHTEEETKQFVGNGIAKLLERALPADKRNTATLQKSLELFTTHYDNHCTDYSVPYKGITETLIEFQNRGILLAVASNKYQKATSKIIAELFPNIQFVQIQGSKEGVAKKPNPSIVYNILQQIEYKEDKDNILYIGDSVTDIQTARNARVKSVSVSWGFRSRAELVEQRPDYIIDSPEQLLNLF